MNLIPEDYKRFLVQLHILQRWGIAVVVFVVLAAAINFALTYKAEQYQKQIVILEKKKAITSQQRNLLTGLQKNHSKLLDKNNVLEKLRGGALAENMFLTVDRALDGNDVWFESWRFDRAGSKTTDPMQGVNTGYFIVISDAERSANKKTEAWKIQTHMEVDGGAKDHEALSSFVRRLLQQPQIGDVKIINTQQRTQADITVVKFKLAITVNSRVKNS